MTASATLNIGTHELSAPVQAIEDPVLAQVLTVLKGIRPVTNTGQTYGVYTTLGDVGFTSLEMVNVMLAVETAFDLMIPAGDITPANFKSAASIAAMISRLKPA